jgi:hypothetical protein
MDEFVADRHALTIPPGFDRGRRKKVRIREIRLIAAAERSWVFREVEVVRAVEENLPESENSGGWKVAHFAIYGRKSTYG